MKYLLSGLVVFLSFSLPAYAYELLKTVVDEPYKIVEITDDVETAQVHLGELDNFPVMYGFQVNSTSSFAVNLRQQYDESSVPLSIGIILVKEDNDKRAITEILRSNPKAEEWQIRKESAYGLAFWDSEVLEKELTPGVYRLEVSSPENNAKYALRIGPVDESPSGYFKSLGQVKVTQEFFGYSMFKMLISSLVYYPLGIIVLLFAIERTWRYRRLISHVR